MSDAAAASKLAQDLEDASGLALDWLRRVLAVPIDEEAGPLLRAQASAAQTVLNTQLRADALRLRSMRQDKVLETLAKLLREKEALVPADSGFQTKESCASLVGSLERQRAETCGAGLGTRAVGAYANALSGALVSDAAGTAG